MLGLCFYSVVAVVSAVVERATVALAVDSYVPLVKFGHRSKNHKFECVQQIWAYYVHSLLNYIAEKPVSLNNWTAIHCRIPCTILSLPLSLSRTDQVDKSVALIHSRWAYASIYTLTHTCTVMLLVLQVIVCSNSTIIDARGYANDECCIQCARTHTDRDRERGIGYRSDLLAYRINVMDKKATKM